MQTKSQRTDLENERTLTGSQIFRILSWERAKLLKFRTIQTQTLAKKIQVSFWQISLIPLILVSHTHKYVLQSMYSTKNFFTVSLLLPGT